MSEDKTGVFNVTLRQLEKKDEGWYWCSVGVLQAAVHINVTQRPTTHRNIAAVTTPTLPMLHSAFSTFRLHSYLCLKDLPH
ncbi:hypothetical protein J4Q44_G00155110 [Coregonus suidteri]|uniref:Immunoglobulin V-set domain-containing protein n=1 Tax=Coregonus suidteri TaxID=861788 RepID=A0AAN8LT50_9TELE